MGLVEKGRKFGTGLRNVLQKVQQNVQSSLSNVSFRVLERPHDRVNDQLEVVRVDCEEGLKAVAVDGSQQVEEVDSVFRIVLEILRNHS